MLHEATLKSVITLPLKAQRDKRMYFTNQEAWISIHLPLCHTSFLVQFALVFKQKFAHQKELQKFQNGIYQGVLYIRNTTRFDATAAVSKFLYKYFWQSDTTTSVGWLADNSVKTTMIDVPYLLNYHVIFTVYINFLNVGAGRGVYVALV
jgi:hypothetical protein